MLDRTPALEQKIAYWQDRELDNPNHLNGFRGTFTFSDHALVPEEVQTLVMQSVKQERFNQVPLDTVNEIARAVHGGKPGFLKRAAERLLEIYLERRAELEDDDDTPKKTTSTYTPELTIDDWSGDNNDRKTELDT